MKFEYHAVLGLQYSHDDNDHKIMLKESRRERRAKERMLTRRRVAQQRRALSW